MHFFDLVAYADNPNWSKCYCCERVVPDYDDRTKAQNRATRSGLIRSAKANGLVAYRLGRVVGWCHAAPKSELLNVPGERSGDVGPVASVTGRVCGGLEGDRHGRRETRAVLVIDRATHDELGLAPGDLREQITIEGLPEVTRLAPETDVRIGGVTLRVNGECDPCTHIGGLLGQADVEAFRVSLEGRRGALCTVVAADGPIRVGDP